MKKREKGRQDTQTMSKANLGRKCKSGNTYGGIKHRAIGNRDKQ